MKSILAFLLTATLLLSHVFSYSQTASTVQVGGTSSINTVPKATATVVDPNLTLTSDGTLSGFTVQITGSYTNGDVLGYNGSLPFGITVLNGSFNTTYKALQFAGIADAATWQDLLRRVTITTANVNCYPEQRQVSFIVGHKLYNLINGHFYEKSANATSWTTGYNNAQSTSYFGRQAYMVTITSAAENSLVASYSVSWLGASDDFNYINTAAGYTKYTQQGSSSGTSSTGSEGFWHWVTGPEKGTLFSSGNTGGGTPLTASGQYANWNSGEPNGNNGGENFGQMLSGGTGLWNDLPATCCNLHTIYEYGDMSTDNVSSNVVFTRTINLSGAPSGTIIDGNVTVCSGTNSTTLTLSGLVSGGTVSKWQSSTDNFLTTTNTTDIANTTTSYTATNITQNRFYRALVNTTGCTNNPTSSTFIKVSAAVAGNIVADNNTICNGASVNFTLNGYSGSIVKWQVSTSSTFATGVTDINNTTAALSYALPTAGTYYFRAVLNSCSNSVNTTPYTITVINGSAPVGGTVNSVSYCGGSNSGSLSLTGSTGNVSKWQYSTDGGIVWTDVANTTTTQSYSAISATRQYRAILTNGSCGTALSAAGVITVNPASVAGTASGTTSVCASTNSTTLSLSGNIGSIQWQSSTNNSTFTDIAGETGANYIATNLSATTYYRAVVSNASCTPATSNTVTVTVKQPSTSTTNASICAGGSYSFAGSNYTTAGTYLVHLTNAVGCDSAATLNLTVNALPPTPTITPSGATTFCAVGSVTLTSDAATSYAWTGGATTQAITVTTGGTYSVTVSNGNCTATSAPVTVVVNSLPVVSGIIQPGQFGNGLNFDGSTDYVSVPSSSSLNISSAITLEAWIYPTKLSGGTQNVMSKSSGGANNGYIFPRTDNSWSSFVVYLNIGGWKTLSFPYPSTGTWHHLAATYDGSTIKLYLDGSMVTSMAVSGAISTNSNILSLGNQPGFNEYYGGNADELRIWNVARTQAQIQATMNTELVGNETGLVAYYNFNQGVAGSNNGATTSVLDKTANANNGSFNTFALNGAISNFVAGATSTGGVAAGNMCVGGTIQLSNTTAGGVWTSSNTAVATVSNTGLVTGVASGTAVISYAVTNANGCTTTVITNVTVNDNPVVPAITGNTSVCVGSTTTLANSTTSGIWSSAATAIATVNANGVVTGVSNGIVAISYVLTNASGCTTTVNTTVTVNALPTVAAISGASTVCVGKTVSYTNATTGGIWSSSNTSVATVDANGVVTGLSAGAAIISYTVANINGCTSTVTKSITVNALPVTTISTNGTTTLCLGNSVTLTASLGSTYAWSNGATTRSITVSTAGNYNVAVTNVNGCTTTSANTTVIVNSPSASTTVIKVPFGATYVFNGVTYSATGIYVAHLTNAVGCDSIATLDFTVDPKPSAGVDQTIACGSTTKTVTLTGTLPTTGVWSSMAGNDPTATIGTNTNGVVEITLPVAPFTGKLSYIYTTFGGKDTVDIYMTGPTSPVINVNAGSPIICSSSTVQLCPQTWGFSNYQWYKDGYVVAGSTGTSSCITVDATGIGSYTLAGTNGAGCWSVPSAPQVVSTTNTLTKPTISASGSTILCNGGSVTLNSSSATGNLWFKNGNSTGAITPSITVTEPGDYSVLVTTGTCTSAMSLTTTIAGGEKAGFITANATNNCDSTFSFTSTSANTTSTWNFGDGTTATGNSVTHKYSTVALFTVQQAVISAGGCKDTAVKTVTIVSCPPPPAPTTCNITPGFTIINNTVNGGSYTYISTSTITNGNMTYFWDLGNGTTSTLISPSVTYATAGTYQVKLVVTGDLGCKDSITQSVVVTIPAPPVTPPACTAPVADFTIANASQCLTGNAFSFTNTSTGTAPSYTWTFGDGNAAVTTTAAAHSYTTANTYTVTLVATNSCGSNQVSKTVTVATVPAMPASISGSTSITAGATTTLSSATTGGVWSSSNTAIATVDANTGVVTAIAAGTTTISYTVSNSCGATATSLGITVTAAVPPVTPPACTAPVANFSINNATQCLTGNSFSFTNSSTGTAPSYTWTFGDGSAAVTTTNATYSYAAGNTYTVTLVATNACGSNQISKTVTVATAPATPSGISGATTITAGTTSNYSSATAGGVWSSTNTAVATVDANTGVVTAVAAGTATINYTVSNSCGATASSLSITVTTAVPPVVVPPTPAPCNINASFSVNNLSQCVNGNQFVFTNTTTGGTAPFIYLWDLNDGTTATTANVSKTYANYGDRDVTMMVTDANGCTSHAATTQIHVGAQPRAGFSILTHTGNGQNTTFISSSTIAAGNMSYLWDLGNGQTSTLINPTTTYTPGTYTVKLLVSGIGTCKDSSIQSITELAVASVKVYPNPVMDVIQVSFVSASATPTTFKLMDLAGRTLQVQTVTPSSRGVNVLATMYTRGLQSGSYVLYISDEQNGFLATKAILKQ